MPVALYQSPTGTLAIETDGKALVGLRFVDEADGLTHSQTGECSEVYRWLDTYFSGSEPEFTPAVRLRGTDFQRRVWHALLEIPYGQTVSYGELARRVGCRSARAVGQAVGRNPVAIVVPCHRVVGTDGSPTGYAYGTERKKRLLALERNPLSCN